MALRSFVLRLFQSSSRCRWWPAVVILGLFVAYAVRTLWFSEADGQFKARGLLRAFQGTALLIAIWWLAFSGVRFRVRLSVIAGVLALGVLMVALVEVRGVTGDYVPVLGWRLRSQVKPVAVAPKPALASKGSATQFSTGMGFPQFQGPARDSKIQGALPTDWEKHGPVLLWKQPVGAGWAGFAVQDRFAVTIEQAGDDEEVVCRDLDTGEKLWTHRYAARYADPSAGDGPRTVPAIADGRVFAAGATGILTCLDLQTGKLHWTRDLMVDHGVALPTWGYSISPLVVDGKVIAIPGGPNGKTVAAYSADSGELQWAAGNSKAGYSSPILHEAGGVRQVLAFDADSISGYDLAEGRQLWRQPIPPHTHVAAPVLVTPDHVLVSAGYGIGSFLVQFRQSADGWTASQQWKSIRLKSKFANVIVRDGYIYGLDDGMLACLDAATGALKWKGTRYGHGQLLLVGETLFVMAENGDGVLVNVAPEGMQELSRMRLLSGKTWNPPAIAGEYLLVRNNEEAACYRLTRE